MGNFAKDSNEQDLWAFDDLDPLDETPSETLPKLPGPGLPVPRDTEKLKIRPLAERPPEKAGGNLDSIRTNITRSRPKNPMASSSGHAKTGSEFDDLEHWDETEFVPVASETPPAETPPATLLTLAEAPPPAALRDELAPAAPSKSPPVSMRPRWNLTKVERLGLVVLTVLLLIGGALAFLNSISRLPSGTDRVKANDFPIQGKHLTIVTAVSFWRAPMPADTARRSTQLIPVVDLSTSGGPAAVRVLFRNSEGAVIGDAVTRFIQSGGKLQIGATAGFDDVGMHAAYRMGDNKPWTIEVLEAATQNAAGHEFRRIFEMDASTDRR